MLHIEHLLDRKTRTTVWRPEAARSPGPSDDPIASRFFNGRTAVQSRRRTARPYAAPRLLSFIGGLKTTFIYVTHDQAEAMTMSDRVVVMMDGDVLQADPADVITTIPLIAPLPNLSEAPRINIFPVNTTRRCAVEYWANAFHSGPSWLRVSPVQVAIRPPGSHFLGIVQRLAGKLVHSENLGSDFAPSSRGARLQRLHRRTNGSITGGCLANRRYGSAFATTRLCTILMLKAIGFPRRGLSRHDGDRHSLSILATVGYRLVFGGPSPCPDGHFHDRPAGLVVLLSLTNYQFGGFGRSP